MLSDKLLPQNIEAEESILGGILLDPNAFDRVANELRPEAFYVNAHREIYQAACALVSIGERVDLMTVTNWLSDHGLLDQVGGTSKLAQLVERTVSAVNIDRYAALVMDKYIRRELIGASCRINSLGFDTSEELDMVLNQSEQSLFSVSNLKLESRLKPNSEIAGRTYNNLDSGCPIYPTDLYDLDKLIVGFEPGTLTILAGRPSMGKSYLSMFFAMQMMVKHNLPVAFFSLEMTDEQLEYRLWSLLSSLPKYQQQNIFPLPSVRIRRYRAGLMKLNNDELACLANLMVISSELPLYISDNRSMVVPGIASECRQLLRSHSRLGLVIIDYLQMMASDTGGNRSYELGDVARGLYKMAGDLNVPVLALSQISRVVEGRNDKRPTMSDLSQSGILEMVADNVILAYREDYYNPSPENQGVLELIVGKSRHGSTGKAKFWFDLSFGLVQNVAPDIREVGNGASC